MFDRAESFDLERESSGQDVDASLMMVNDDDEHVFADCSDEDAMLSAMDRSYSVIDNLTTAVEPTAMRYTESVQSESAAECDQSDDEDGHWRMSMDTPNASFAADTSRISVDSSQFYDAALPAVKQITADSSHSMERDTTTESDLSNPRVSASNIPESAASSVSCSFKSFGSHGGSLTTVESSARGSFMQNVCATSAADHANRRKYSDHTMSSIGSSLSASPSFLLSASSDHRNKIMAWSNDHTSNVPLKLTTSVGSGRESPTSRKHGKSDMSAPMIADVKTCIAHNRNNVDNKLASRFTFNKAFEPVPITTSLAAFTASTTSTVTIGATSMTEECCHSPEEDSFDHALVAQRIRKLLYKKLLPELSRTVLNNLAALFMQLRKYEDALHACNDAFTLSQVCVRNLTLQLLRYFFRQCHNHIKQQEYNLEPDARIFYRRGSIHLQLHNFDESLADLVAAQKLSPLDSNIASKVREVKLQRDGQKKRTLKVYRQMFG